MDEFSLIMAFIVICVTIFLIVFYLSMESFMDNLSMIQSIVVPKYYPIEEEKLENFSGKRKNV